MSWVLISLRKKELKRTHADYVAQELDISRKERQMSRRYQYEQTCVQNDQNSTLRQLKSDYKDQRDNINSLIDSLKEGANNQQSNNNSNNEQNGVSQVDFSSYVDGNNKTLNDYYKELEAAKEDYEENVNEAKTFWEDELQMIEEEANDYETMYEQEKVNAETQMEAISQELSALDQALSSEIQNSTIKLS